MLKTSIFTVCGLAAMVNSHMLLNIPKPFPSQDSAGNGPLDGSGSNFPCKSTGPATYEGGTATPMALGSTQPLQFKGGATHSGGSCQISITYDTAPTKSSVWKVIHSIEGGCPIASDGNFGIDASAITPGNFKFTIPDNLPTGKAVLAWTWINKTGNREFYMNCAPIEITGTASKRSDEDTLAGNVTQLIQRDTAAYDALPDMFVMNIPTTDCTIAEKFDVKFPNPGASVETLAGGNFGTPTGPKCGAAVAAPAGGSGSGSGSSASPVASVPTSIAPAPVTPPGGVFATVAPQVPAPAQSSAAPAVPSPVASAAPSAAPPAVPSAAPSSAPAAPGNSSGALTGACTTEGLWNCIGGTSFQRCASGTWSVVQSVAAGTSCTVGTSETIAMVATKPKRAIRFSHAHARRHIYPIPQ